MFRKAYRFWPEAAVAGLLVFSSCQTAAAETLSPRKVTIEGTEHIALPTDQMGKVRVLLEAEKKQRTLIRDQDALIAAQKLVVSTATAAVAVQADIIKTQTQVIKELGDLGRQLGDNSGSVLSSPLFVIPVVAAVTLGLVLIFLPRSTAPNTTIITAP